MRDLLALLRSDHDDPLARFLHRMRVGLAVAALILLLSQVR